MGKVYKGTENNVRIIGGLKSVPQVHVSEYGEIATINVATKSSTFDKESDSYIDTSCWHTVVVKNQYALFLKNYGHPGMRLLIDGFLKTRKIELPEKPVYYVTEIIAERVEMMDSKKPDTNINDSNN